MKSNEALQKDVADAIQWEPLLSAAEIGVTAKDGVITLSGYVDSYSKKVEAEKAAQSVDGVRAVAQEIEFSASDFYKKKDAEIAEEVIDAFKISGDVPNDLIKVIVENGWVTLEGELEWNYQKLAAGKAVGFLPGVVAITNNIKLKSQRLDAIEKKDIEAAFKRNWSLNDVDITVEVSSNKVTLSGNVHSFYQKDEAEQIAWRAPGIISLDNRLMITVGQ